MLGLPSHSTDVITFRLRGKCEESGRTRMSKALVSSRNVLFPNLSRTWHLKEARMPTVTTSLTPVPEIEVLNPEYTFFRELTDLK